MDAKKNKWLKQTFPLFLGILAASVESRLEVSGSPRLNVGVLYYMSRVVEEGMELGSGVPRLLGVVVGDICRYTRDYISGPCLTKQ